MIDQENQKYEEMECNKQKILKEAEVRMEIMRKPYEKLHDNKVFDKEESQKT